MASGILSARSRLVTVALLVAVMVLAGASTAFAVSIDTFATRPVVAAAEAPNTWYVDRFKPAVFDSTWFNGGYRLRLGIAASDFQGLGNFAATQGRKYDLPAGTTMTQGDLYVGPDWNGAVARRSDLWATAVDAQGATCGYPMIGFLNNPTAFSGTPAYTGFRCWDNNGWHNVAPAGGVVFGKWYTLKTVMSATKVDYYIDGQVVYTSTFASDPDMATAVQYHDVMLQGYNFNSSYDIYWDNVWNVQPGPNPTITPASSPWSLALLALAGLAVVGVFQFKAKEARA